MDNISSKVRSENMSKIRSNNTKPELCIRSLLHAAGYRYRVNYKLVPGSPDIYFTRKKVAVFIHGCFWHRHDMCNYAYAPKSNVEFWNNKFSANMARDRKNKEKILSEGIRMLVIWECTIKECRKNKNLGHLLSEIEAFINNTQCNYLEL